VGALEIRGRMSGEVVAETFVTICKSGVLEGNVVARSINVEKGGSFTGQLVIGPKRYEQGELLTDVEEQPAEVGNKEPHPPPHPFGLPATT
jgi:cytoskeletal protein CcmA (bactofilin family)